MSDESEQSLRWLENYVRILEKQFENFDAENRLCKRPSHIKSQLKLYLKEMRKILNQKRQKINKSKHKRKLETRK